MHIITDLATVRVISEGSPFDVSEDIVVQKLEEGTWVRVRGFNSLSNDYAYSEASSCARGILADQQQAAR